MKKKRLNYTAFTILVILGIALIFFEKAIFDSPFLRIIVSYGAGILISIIVINFGVQEDSAEK